MDYDDNDFQSQNLHIAGEGSTNYSPVLQPFGLPKFDFDDNLQGHLRFDSLVETEVFLGIESCEANNWIEDFSRGSSGIEFSSSAVESCSISRRDNVWSEATSSESVEMLLKSVGQEEVIPAQTVIEESDACKDVAGLTKQMEPNLQNDNIFADIRDTDLESTILPDGITRNLSGLQDVGELSQVEDASQTKEVELPVDGNSVGQEEVILAQTVVEESDACKDVDGLTKPMEPNLQNDDNIFADIRDTDLESTILPHGITGNLSGLQNVGEQSQVEDASQTKEVELPVDGNSAGQEEVIPAQTVVEESDACKDVAGLTKQMKPNLQNDDNIFADIRDTDLESTILPHGRITKNLSGLQDDVGEQPQVKDSSQTKEVELPVDGNSSVMDPNYVSGQNSLHVTEGSLLADEKCNDVNNREFDNLVDNPPEEKTHENFSASEMQVDSMMTSAENNVGSSDDLHHQDVLNHVKEIGEENLGCPAVSVDVKPGNENEVQGASCPLEVPYLTVSQVEPAGMEIDEDNVSNVNNTQDPSPSDVILPADCNLGAMGGCSDKEHSGGPAVTNECEDMLELRDTGNGSDQSEINANDVSPITHGNGGYAVELSNCNAEASSALDPTLKRDSELKIADRCSDKVCPEVIAETIKCEELVSFKDADTGGDHSNSNSHDLSSNAYRSDSGLAAELGKCNAGVSSSIDSTLERDSELQTVDICTDRECPEVLAETIKCEDVVSLKDTQSVGDQLKSNSQDLSPMAYRSDSGHAIGLSNRSAGALSCLDPIMKGDFELCTVDKEGPEVLVGTNSNEDIALLKETDNTADQSNLCPHDSAPMAYRSDAGNPGEVRSSDSGILSSLDPIVKVDSGPSSKEDTLDSGSRRDNEILVRTEASSIEENEVLKGGGDENWDHANLTATCSSVETPSEVHVAGASNSPCVAFEDSSQKLNAGTHVSASILVESTQTCDESEVDKDVKAGDCDQDLSHSENDPAKLHNESNSIGLMSSVSVSKGVGSLSVCEDVTEKELIDPISKQDANVKESVADLESPNLESCGIIDVVPLSSENVATTEDAIKISEDVSVPCTVPSPSVKTGLVPGLETEKGASCDTAVQLLCKTVDQSPPKSDSSNREKPSGPESPVANEPSKSSTNDMEEFSVQSSVKEARDDRVLTEAKSEKTSANVTGNAPRLVECSLQSSPLPESPAKFSALESGGSPTDTNRPDCGSPKVFKTIELPEAKHEKGNIDGSTNQIAPDTNVKDGGETSSSSNPAGDAVSKDQSHGTSGDAAKNSQPCPVIPAPKITDITQTNSSSIQMDAKISAEVSYGAPQVSDGVVARGGSKGTTERKRRRASNKGTGQESAKKGTAKGTTSKSQAEKGDNSSSVSLSKSGFFQFAQPTETQYYGLADSGTKTYSVHASSTSSVPDLNSSALPSVVFQQPFTDLQQVQLRAQIFVYGALIQGIAPEEAYMVSAFGGPDGGKSMWDNAWRTFIERLRGQRSALFNPQTPLQSSGTMDPDQVVKQSIFQNKAISSPVGRTSTKGVPPVASPMIPISSPLWSIPTPTCEAPQYSVVPRGSVMDYQQAHTPLHPLQTSPIMNLVGHHSSWLSQASLLGPWVASPRSSAAEATIHFSAFPGTESVMLTPVKETNLPQMSSMKHTPSGLAGQTGGSTGIFAGVSPLLDPTKVSASLGQPPAHPKSRKRKKIPDSEEIGQITSKPRTHPESASTHTVNSSLSTSVDIITPSTFVSKAMPEKLVMTVPPISPSYHLKRVTMSEETLTKAKEAKQQAEEASAHAAAAISHSQEIWSQLDKQRNSRLISDADAKLASAAVAVAAAAAVAKAAAAAANVASNAALQAVLMAEEAYGYGTTNLSTDGVNAVGLSTSFRGEGGTNNSSSVIFAAGEAAKRVETASAASKRAENMDAIVKAAELAAEAVSQAGTVVAMGDPLPLSELVKAGPEGYWKVSQVSTDLVKKSNVMTTEQPNVINIGGDTDASARQPNKIETQITGEEVIDFASKSTLTTVERDFEKVAPASTNSSIMAGSQVEVFKDGSGYGLAWFTATVLSLQGGKAFVCYTELQSDDGSGQLQEWVGLEGKGDEPPKIRVARLLTPSLEGTRKRRREAIANYAWSVGDKVDAWIQNSWWEGVVTEKNKKDETILKVDFPAQGETSHVKAWHLRPSLIWKDGEWVEWSSNQNDCSALEDDMPQEKRIKLGSPTVEVKEKDKTCDIVQSGKPEETKLLNLSAIEQVFNMGKNTRTNKPDAARTTRTGLQKEGSVKFGIPKPKRKYMDVSKHYVTNQTTKVDANDSVKVAKYLMPQPSGFRALKNTKEKQVNESKLKGLKSEKQRSVFTKTIPQKDIMSTDLVSATDNTRSKVSVRHYEGLSGKRNLTGSGSSHSTDGRAQEPLVFSSRAPSSGIPSSKKVSTSTAKSERADKGNFTSASGRLGKIEEGKSTSSSNPANSTSEVAEPRRSNRRIQPTSRLLEGLQSSLSLSKIPSVPHDKGRSQNRNASRG